MDIKETIKTPILKYLQEHQYVDDSGRILSSQRAYIWDVTDVTIDPALIPNLRIPSGKFLGGMSVVVARNRLSDWHRQFGFPQGIYQFQALAVLASTLSVKYNLSHNVNQNNEATLHGWGIRVPVEQVITLRTPENKPIIAGKDLENLVGAVRAFDQLVNNPDLDFLNSSWNYIQGQTQKLISRAVAAQRAAQ